MRTGWLYGVLILGVLVSAGCSKPQEAASPAQDGRAPDSYKVHFATTKGDFVVTVERKWAPVGADRFYTLVKSGYYDGARFFRVLPGFVVQFGIAGDPALTAKWRNANLPDDPVTESNRRATVSFATAGPNTRTAQVFINLSDSNARLDANGFAPFGTVSQGMEIVDQFYNGYGEGAPRGSGPAQEQADAEGNAYLEREFPKLDSIKKAIIEK